MSRRLALLVAALPLTASADDCPVTGSSVTLEHVRVQPAGAGLAPLDLDVRGVAVRATIRSGKSVDLELTGAIAFKATTTGLWWTLAEPAETADKLVELTAGAHLVHVRADGDSVIADAVLHAPDVMPGEIKEPDEYVGPVRIACKKLTLDWALGTDLETTGDGSNWRPRRNPNRITLRSAPKAKASVVTVRAPNCSGEGCVTVERVESRAGWFLVATANEGVRTAGWVRRSELVKLPDTMGVGRSYGCYGDHGRGVTGFGRAGGETAVEGPATIKVGTVIHADPAAGPWATVVQDGFYRVRIVRGEAWAEVTQIPGITGAMFSAYVPIAAVTLTAEP